jgi:hypothetical protein
MTNPTYDESDVYLPFVQGIDIDEYDSVHRNIEILRDEDRVKHIRVKGSLIEVLKTMNELDGRD